MIGTESVFNALEREIHKVLPEIIVSPNFIDSSEKSYVWVRLREGRTDEGYGYIVRKISVDLQVVLTPAENLAVLSSKLYEIADDFAQVFNGFLRVEDRAITLYNSDSRIYDGILTYSFNLEFADGVERKFDAHEKYQKMENLHLKKL